MDLGAFRIGQLPSVVEYIKKYYGEVPRMRGVRFMKIEEPIENENNSPQLEMFNKYCGQDVIHFHTRCGHGLFGWNGPHSNYKCFKADEWEEKNKKLFLDHITDEFDCTYCDHYFKAVVDEDYKNLINKGEN